MRTRKPLTVLTMEAAASYSDADLTAILSSVDVSGLSDDQRDTLAERVGMAYACGETDRRAYSEARRILR